MKPNFKLKNSEGKTKALEDYKGKYLVLYFYPKDDTPGCTTEGIEFSRLKPEFEKLNAIVVGISPDSEKSHCDFAEKQGLNITLLSDPEKETIKEFGAWGKKNIYGKEVESVIRSTFLIDTEGNIVEEWKKVKPAGHAEEVLEKLKEIQNGS